MTDLRVIASVRKYRDSIVDQLQGASDEDRARLLPSLKWATEKLIRYEGREWIHGRIYLQCLDPTLKLAPPPPLLADRPVWSGPQPPAPKQPSKKQKPRRCPFTVGDWQCGGYVGADPHERFCPAHRTEHDRRATIERRTPKPARTDLQPVIDDRRPRWRDASSVVPEEAALAAPIIETERIEDPFDHRSLLPHRTIERIGAVTQSWAYSFERRSKHKRRYEGFTKH